MREALFQTFTCFMGFFAIMNPIANVPIFLALTEGDDEETRRAVARKSVTLAFGVVLVFALAGKPLLDLFGITLPSFRITGGILVFVIGFHMLLGTPSVIQHPSEHESRGSREAALGVAVSPLAMPILAGPGTITTTLSFAGRGRFVDVVATVVAFAVLCVLTYVLFRFGERFVRSIGAGALGAVTRIMGLILAVIGTQMAIDGIQGVFDGAA